jgi:molybdopterin-guanine dinucleotide biosynthesis adapter protein
MKVVGFAGFSGAGKTTLVEQVVRLLREQGKSVSVIKHAHSSFDVDKPGKDSYRHREAGAYEVMLVSKKRMALLREWQLEEPPSMDVLLKEMKPVDWVLIEGFKHASIPKIEVWRADNEQPLRLMDDQHIIAIATDTPKSLPPDIAIEVLNINEPAHIVRFLTQHAARFEVQP